MVTVCWGFFADYLEGAAFRIRTRPQIPGGGNTHPQLSSTADAEAGRRAQGGKADQHAVRSFPGPGRARTARFSARSPRHVRHRALRSALTARKGLFSNTLLFSYKHPCKINIVGFIPTKYALRPKRLSDKSAQVPWLIRE